MYFIPRNHKILIIMFRYAAQMPLCYTKGQGFTPSHNALRSTGNPEAEISHMHMEDVTMHIQNDGARVRGVKFTFTSLP